MRGSALLCVVCLVTAAVPLAVQAQEAGGALQFGPTTVRPTLGFGVLANDNVRASENDAAGDIAAITQPALQLNIDGRDFDWSLLGSARFDRYATETDENEETYRASTALDYTATNDLDFNGRLDFTRASEDRTDADTDDGAQRFVFNDFGVNAGARWRLNRISLAPNGGITRRDFDDEIRADREFTRYDGNLRVGFRVSPAFSTFLQPGVTWRDFDDPDGGGLDQDSLTHRGLVGSSFELGNLIEAEFAIGLFQEDFADSDREDFTGLQLNGSLTWNVTPLTDVIFTIDRREETSFVEEGNEQADSRIRTEARFGVEHALTNRTTLDADLRLRLDDYQGLQRSDTRFTIGLGASYRLNRWVALTGSYQFDRRTSDADDAGFIRNSLFVGLRSGL
ncbi:outer membrane beta-barrel protein [Algihabitans albus]|uniref:outer membrane beta-barrel protein n=1 Tax=Algihabitans albus TaxID=2164067 RepID=UPI000E5D5832|nr:outer membrane beta-barrel protein [Algihabitans albus]